MNIFFFLISSLIIFQFYDIYCFTNNNNLNNETIIRIDNDEFNEDDIIKGKQLLFESYKYYNNIILFNRPRNTQSNFTLAKYYNTTKKYKPFPNDEFNIYNNGNECGENFISVMSFEVDDENYLYILDEGSDKCPAKLYKMKMDGNKIEEKEIYNISKIVNIQNKLLNDFVIDKVNNYAYIIYIDGTSKESNKQSLQIIGIDLDKKNVKFNEVKIDFDENYVISEELNQSFPKIFSYFSDKLVTLLIFHYHVMLKLCLFLLLLQEKYILFLQKILEKTKKKL